MQKRIKHLKRLVVLFVAFMVIGKIDEIVQERAEKAKAKLVNEAMTRSQKEHDAWLKTPDGLWY